MSHPSRFSFIVASAMLFVAACSLAPADAWIATQIEAKFFSDPIVKTANILVSVNKGEVTLAGTVGSANVQLRAFKIALETHGVRKLNDKMSVAVAAEQHQVIAQQLPPRLPDHKPSLSAPAAQGPPTSAAHDQVQVVRQIERPPVTSKITVFVEAPPPPLAVASTVTEPVPGEINAAAGPAIEIVAPSVAGPWIAPSHDPVTLRAAGATAPAALLQKWFFGFQQADPQAAITYEAIGSGGGIRLLLEGNADLADIEIPLTDQQLSRFPDRRILHFPAALWGIVPIFNVGETGQALNFSGAVLAAIFSGKITRWDDPAIAILNPRAVLPAGDITVVHRSDGAGTTFVFTDYLSAVSPDWKARVGAAASINWPVGLGGKGDEGVAGLVKETPNSIGYADLSYALQNGLDHASIQNRSGYFVKANAGSLAAAAAYMANSIPPDFRGSIVNALGRDAYPIASFTWLVTPDRFPDSNKRAAAKSFLGWMLTRGQYEPGQLGYVRLPAAFAFREQAQISKIQ